MLATSFKKLHLIIGPRLIHHPGHHYTATATATQGKHVFDIFLVWPFCFLLPFYFLSTSYILWSGASRKSGLAGQDPPATPSMGTHFIKIPTNVY